MLYACLHYIFFATPDGFAALRYMMLLLHAGAKAADYATLTPLCRFATLIDLIDARLSYAIISRLMILSFTPDDFRFFILRLFI